MAPSISIVVPVYNLELYVERCLGSLERQTMEDIEVLVVDDGSTDDSPDRIEEFVRRDSRFKGFTKPNGGHGSACNFGIERATGEYVMLVDGDDWIDEDTSERMYAKAVDADADLLMGNLKYIFSGHTDRHQPIDLEREKLLDERDRARLFMQWATPNARLYRRTLFKDPALRFLPRIIFADVNFAPKSYLAAQRVFYVNEEFYNYDVTRPTQSMKQTDRRVLNVIPALRDMLDFYRVKFAFRAYESELMHYATRHVVTWLDRVKVLHGYSRENAVRELFSVLDDYFDDAWMGAPLEEIAGGRRALFIRQAKRFNYSPIVWAWTLGERARYVDDDVEKVLSLPMRGYRKVKSNLRSRVIERLFT